MPPKTAGRPVLQPGDRFLTEKEAAEFLRRSPNTLNFWRVVGRGPRFYRHNRYIRYLLSDLMEWGTNNRVEPERLRA